MIAPIKSIDNTSLADRAEMSLINYFIENKLKPGDPIPTEVELSEALNVSRTVIREVLIRLRTVGLVESKRHKGTVITNPNLLEYRQQHALKIFQRFISCNFIKLSVKPDLVFDIGKDPIAFFGSLFDDFSQLLDVLVRDALKQQISHPDFQYQA